MSLMREEIREQPEALTRTLDAAIPQLRDLQARLTADRPRLIVLAARGTSDNAATFGRYLLELTTGIPVSLAAPSIYTLYEKPIDLRGTLVVAVSQSGESTDTNRVLEVAKAAGAMTVGITNEPASSMAKLAEFSVLVSAHRERSVAATKTYTGQLLAFYLLAHALGGAIALDDLQRLPAFVEKALTVEDIIASRVERYRFMDHAVVIGRGLNYANAFEFALKLMETSYVVAERFSTADLLHGPIAMVEASFPAFLFAPVGVTWPGMRDMLAKLVELKAEALVVTDQSQRDLPTGVRSVVVPADLLYRGTDLPSDVYTAIPYIVPAQLFAAALAEVKGLNPDQPRTLSKVTRTL